MIAPRLVGTFKNLVLFEARGKSVVVNTRTLTASVANDDSELVKKAWRTVQTTADPVWSEIASASLRRELTPSDITLAEADKRTYTVPKRVTEAAAACTRADGCLTPTSTYVSNLLSSGQQVTVEDVLWISRFYDTHDAESTERAVWLAWGGDEGKRWSQGLSSRLDYDSVVADAGTYETPGVELLLDSEENGRSFYTVLSGQNATSLYMLDEFGTWSAWGNGDWFTCLPPDPTSTFIELDEESALYVAGALFDAPDTGVDLREPNPEAWDLAVAAYDEIDWTLTDRSMTAAAGDPVPPSPPAADYTPEERSENASGQLRDANGRFANVGDAGAVKSSGIGGTITAADEATGQVTIQGDDGQTYQIPSSDFEVGAAAHPAPDPSVAKDALDLSGILAPTAEPAPPRATLSKEGSVLSPAQITEALEVYEAYVGFQRQVKAKDFRKMLNKEPVDVPAEGEEEEEEVVAAGAPEVAQPTPTGTTVESDVPPPSADPTPDQSDVKPVYMAIVDRDDPQAVLDLVALVPSTAVTSDPKTFRRAAGKWVEDNKILTDLRSATPPAIIQLDADQFEDVLAQVDMAGTDIAGAEGEAESEQTITAAGGADRNRGNAEELRKYWTVGPGGLKIRWDTGGDWTRCVRLLSKHLGNRAKGYCALRHHEMTGMWPGDKKNRQAIAASAFSTDFIKRMPAVYRDSITAAAVATARHRVFNADYEPIPTNENYITPDRQGKAFCIPLLAPEGLATGDGRTFAKGSLGIRTLPLPLLWQIQTGEGHNGSVLVGRIDKIERIKGGLGNVYGVFDTGPYGAEAQRLVENNMLRWVSVDLDKFEVDDNRSDLENGKMFIKKGRAMGATLVPKPAFQEVTIELVPEDMEMPMNAVPSAIMASASIANAIPVEPPSAWFERPLLNGPSPITVTDEGQLFGHIATWDTDHIGLANSIRPPRSSSNYAYFHTGVVRTEDHKDVRVGQLTLSGGHAPLRLNAELAIKHYDDTSSAVADIHVGEDRFGIWVSGALRPGTTAEQIRALRAAAPSGDWRAINRRLELVAICQVNVPGFPVPRALAASGAPTEDGEPQALVAAGTSTLLAIRQREMFGNSTELANAARSRIFHALNVDGYLSEFKTFSEEKRQKLASEGKALADGSFPIENKSDLRRAVLAYGRAEDSKKAKVRRHIVKHARKLGVESMIPSNWKEAAVSDAALSHREQYEAMVASARQREFAAIRERVIPPTAEELAVRAAAFRSRINK